MRVNGSFWKTLSHSRTWSNNEEENILGLGGINHKNHKRLKRRGEAPKGAFPSCPSCASMFAPQIPLREAAMLIDFSFIS